MAFMALAPALIGAGSSLLGGLMGSSSQSQQSALQAAIANRQFAEQDQNRNLSLASKTDANGNQVVFDPSTNSWVTLLSNTSRQLNDATNAEQLQQLTHDAPQARSLRDALAAREQKEGGVADNLMADMQHRLQNPSANNAANANARLLNNRNTLDAQQAALRGFETQGLRSGNSNITDAIDRSRAETGGMLAHNEAVDAGNAPADAYQGIGPTADLYNSFASRAAGGTGATVTPYTGGQSLQQVLAQSAAGAAAGGQGAGQVGNAYLQSLHPDYSGANAVIGGGAALAGLLKDPNVSKYLTSLGGSSDFNLNKSVQSDPSTWANIFSGA